MLPYYVSVYHPDEAHRSRRRRDNPRYCIFDSETNAMLHNAGGFGFTDFATAHVFWLNQGKGRVEEYLEQEKAVWAYFREHVMEYIELTAYYDELAVNCHVISLDRKFGNLMKGACDATGFDGFTILRFLALYPEDDPEIFYDLGTEDTPDD